MPEQLCCGGPLPICAALRWRSGFVRDCAAASVISGILSRPSSPDDYSNGRALVISTATFPLPVGLLAVGVFPLTMSNTFHGPDEFLDPSGFHMPEKVDRSVFVVAISSFGRSQILKSCRYHDWHKVELSRLGVDPGVFAPRAPHEPRTPVELLRVGRLAPVKGQHVLLDAVARLLAQDHVVRLRLAGGGPDRRSLEQHAEDLGLGDAVVFEGWCNRDRVRQLYRNADIYVMASFAEGIPVVLMEAMAMGIPCVATYVAGIPELIEHGSTGLLVPASDAAALADALGRLIRDPQLVGRLGTAGRLKVLEDFELERNTRALAGVFSRRLGRAGVERCSRPST